MGPPALLLCWTYLWPSVFLAQQVCVEKSHLPLALVGEAPHQLPVAHVVKLLPVLLSFTAFLIPTDCLHTEIAKHCLRMKCTDRGAVTHWGLQDLPAWLLQLTNYWQPSVSQNLICCLHTRDSWLHSCPGVSKFTLPQSFPFLKIMYLSILKINLVSREIRKLKAEDRCSAGFYCCTSMDFKGAIALHTSWYSVSEYSGCAVFISIIFFKSFMTLSSHWRQRITTGSH